MERHERSKDDDNRLMSLLLGCDVVRVDHACECFRQTGRRGAWMMMFEGAGR